MTEEGKKLISRRTEIITTVPKCMLSDDDLSKACYDLISKMCKTGGRAFTMSVPVDVNRDSDIILCELIERFNKLREQKS